MEQAENIIANNRDEIYLKDFDEAIDNWKIPKMSYDPPFIIL